MKTLQVTAIVSAIASLVMVAVLVVNYDKTETERVQRRGHALAN